MKIGIPIELKSNESRVAMTPAGVKQLVLNGHEVYIQENAGIKSGFKNTDYQEAGANIVLSIGAVYDIAELIVKVKEPVESEYTLINENQIVFTYFHFASNEALTKAIAKSGAIAIAYETIELKDGSLPLLIPMSEVAGRMSIQQGAKYLESTFGGLGVLLGGVPGVLPASVLIIGGGVVGTEAAKMAAGLGADVTVMDINLKRLRYLNDTLPANVKTMMANEYNIRTMSSGSDLIIGAVLIPGAKAPSLIKKDMLKTMKPGTLLVDVAIDQGGCFETSNPTTHDKPTYTVDQVIHYCVANMPGAVPQTSTIALTNATLPYVISLANSGWEKACHKDEALMKGINIIKGDVVHPKVAEAFELPLKEFSY